MTKTMIVMMKTVMLVTMVRVKVMMKKLMMKEVLTKGCEVSSQSRVYVGLEKSTTGLEERHNEEDENINKKISHFPIKKNSFKLSLINTNY